MKLWIGLVMTALLVVCTLGCVSPGDVRRTNNLREDLKQYQLSRDIEVIAGGPNLSAEQITAELETSPRIILENTTGETIDCNIFDRKFRWQKPLNIKVLPRQTVVLPDDRPDSAMIFRFGDTYEASFGYLGSDSRGGYSFYVSPHGSYYDIIRPDGTVDPTYYHAKVQFNRSGVGAIYQYR